MLVAYIRCWLPSSLLGRADELFFKRSRGKHQVCPWWQKAANNIVLAYADQQIITGIAILTAGFIKMHTLSVYHLQVIIYLAWMSSNTHLSAISLLQTEFRCQKRPKSRALRIIGMSVVGIMVLVALVPTAGEMWALVVLNGGAFAAGFPARCFWKLKKTGPVKSDSAWSFVILIASFFWKGMLLFETSHRLIKVRVRRTLLGKLTRRLDSILTRMQERPDSSMWLYFRYQLSLSLYLAVWYIFELSESFVVSLWICGGGLAWGSIQILTIRSTMPDGITKEENSWGFGQLLAVLLLGLPVFVCVERFWGKKLSDPSKPKTNNRGSDVGNEVNDLESKKHEGEQQRRQSNERNLPALDHEALLETQPTQGLGNQLSMEQQQQIPLPIWKREDDIYHFRFTVGFFWLSQISALATIGIFCIFYILVLGNLYLGTSLSMTVGFSLGGWAGLILLWFLGGMIFSRLFRVDQLTRQRARYGQENGATRVR